MQSADIFGNEGTMKDATLVAIDGARPFDYQANVDAKTATKLRSTADRVRSRHRQQVVAILETGKDLIAAKDLLPHGQFAPWLEAEFTWDERTARNYMSAAETFGGAKTEIVSEMQPTALYALASPTTPAAARDAVIGRLESGEKIATQEIKRIVSDARGAEQRAKAEAKLSLEDKLKQAKIKARKKANREAQEKRWAIERKEQDEKNAQRKLNSKTAAKIIYAALGDEQVISLIDLVRDLYNQELVRELTVLVGAKA